MIINYHEQIKLQIDKSGGFLSRSTKILWFSKKNWVSQTNSLQCQIFIDFFSIDNHIDKLKCFNKFEFSTSNEYRKRLIPNAHFYFFESNKIYILLAYKQVQMKPVLLILCFFISVLSLKNIPIQSQPGSSFPTTNIDTLHFLDNEILFMLSDKSKFGYFTKAQCKITMSVGVEDNENFVGYNQINLIYVEGKRIKTFNIKEKELNIVRPLKRFKSINYEQILNVSHFLFKEKFYFILTDKNLLKVPIESANSTNILSIYNRSQEEEFKAQVFVFAKKQQNEANMMIGLVSERKGKQSKQSDGKQICLKLFKIIEQDSYKELQKVCYPSAKDSSLQKAQFKGGFFYLIMNDFTYVIDLGLKLINKVKGKALSVSNSMMILEGGSSFLSEKNAVFEQVLFESQTKKMYKLALTDSKVRVLNSEEKVLGQIERREKLKPINGWANQKEKYLELVVQWDDFTLEFFSIKDGKAERICRLAKK